MSQTAVRRLALRPVRPAGWWFDGALVAGFALITAALAAGYLLDLDNAVADWLIGTPRWVLDICQVLNYLGQGGKLLTPLTFLLAVLLAYRTRSARPFLVVACAFALTFLTVGPLKLWTQRAAPGSPMPDRVELFNPADPGLALSISYPSGHVVNSIVWYGAIAILLGALVRLPAWVYAVVAFAPPAIVFMTTTVLRYHWLTDSAAALLLGWFLYRLQARVPWDTMPLPRFVGSWSRPAGLPS